MPPSTDAVRAPQSPAKEKPTNEKPKEKRKFLPPVAWLLGRQLIASFKGTLLYTAFGSKLDARDWMRAQEYPSADQTAAEKSWQEQADKTWQKQPEGKDFWTERGEFWFDYISDTGDGMRATYSLAYLCMSDLWAEGALKEDLQGKPFGPSRSGPAVGFLAGAGAPTQKSDEYPNADLNRAAADFDKTRATAMPRGQFLLVGGDATYHLSDYEGLHTRFQTPFSWAHADVKKDGRLLKDTRRPLFGIPGNHDYYDQLDGFRRLFRDPVREDRDLPPGRELEGPQLMIPGFVRRQEASFVGLRLPFGWHLWGLDTELGKVDDRQRKFFRDIKVKDGRSVEQGAKPDKLIVATCAPTTVFGKHADRDDERSAKAFYQLGLPRPFLDPRDEDTDDRKNTLETGQCRIDLSGDIHQYARYWGRASGHDPRGSGGPQKESDHYASVVSGLGGAFHHPSTTDAGEICEQVLYPPRLESRQAVADEIFKPWRIIRGGGVWAIGFLLAFLLYFASTIALSSSQAVANFPPLQWAGITAETTIEPAAARGPQPSSVQRLWPWSVLFGELWVRPPQFKSFAFFWGRDPLKAPPDYVMGVVLAGLSFVLICLAFVPAERFYKKYSKHKEVARKVIPPATEKTGEAEETGEDLTQSGAHRRAAELLSEASAQIKIARGEYGDTPAQSAAWYEKLMGQYSFWVGLAVLLSSLAFAGAMLALEPYRTFITPFSISLMVLFTLAWATAATVLGMRYTDWLSRMASEITILRRHWILVWGLSAVSLLGVICGFAIFGRYNTAADMFTDILLTLVSLGVLVGLTALGASKFGEVKTGATRKWYGALGLLLGLFHALLQLLTPFLLVRKGTWEAWGASLLLLALMQFAGWGLMRSKLYKLLPVLWLAAGTLMLAIPYLTFRMWPPPPLPRCREGLTAFQCYEGVLSNLFGGADAWGALALCIVAGLVGLLSSCVWLGWYFATALAYDGHNNEAGGAARIERYKEFIRFRLTDADLTGFVIAVDDPQEHGNMLRPRLIDVIHLTRKK